MENGRPVLVAPPGAPQITPELVKPLLADFTLSVMLDVNLLFACAWKLQAQHVAASAWLDTQSGFYTCHRNFAPSSQHGPGFRVSGIGISNALFGKRESTDEPVGCQ